MHASSIEKNSNDIGYQSQNNIFKFDQEDPILSTQNSEESSEFLNDLNEAVFSLESCVDYFNEYNQIFNMNNTTPNLTQNTINAPVTAWTDYENLNFFEEEKHQQTQQFHHQQPPHQNENDVILIENEENTAQNEENNDEDRNEEENEDEVDENNNSNSEERDDDEVEEEKLEKRVPNSAEALKMFNGLKRFLSKYTPDSNDVIFDLEKKVNQGIENNKKIKKFCFN